MRCWGREGRERHGPSRCVMAVTSASGAPRRQLQLSDLRGWTGSSPLPRVDSEQALNEALGGNLLVNWPLEKLSVQAEHCVSFRWPRPGSVSCCLSQLARVEPTQKPLPAFALLLCMLPEELCSP